MKRTLLSLSLIFWMGNTAHASGPLSDIQQLLKDHNITVGTAPEQLIQGTGDIVLTRGTWNDPQVAAYTEKYQQRPVVLPLSGPRIADKSDIDAFSHTQHEQIYHLYLRLPDAQDTKDDLVKKLDALLQDDFQDKLKERNLYQTPECYRELWRVRLGLQPARFSGGDY